MVKLLKTSGLGKQKVFAISFLTESLIGVY